MKKVIIIGIFFIVSVNAIAQTYDPEKAAEYASFWCDKKNTIGSPDYNPVKWGGPYHDYSSGQGGDCANFVSQCLKAGGLDLSLGAYGVSGGTGEVDDKGCIKGAHELTIHLEKYQKITSTVVTGFNPPDDHDLGDPMFQISNGRAGHSLICSSLDNSAVHLYSYHSNDNCDKNVSSSYDGLQLKFFHITSSTPDHCNNCVLDGDETDIDCGGSCPPCQQAKRAVNYNYNTSSLPTTTRAMESITAGNADVIIKLGQNVTFIAAGDVTLKSGFHAQPGSNFKALKSKTRKDVGADCGDFCMPHRNVVCLDMPPKHDNYGWDLANVTSVTITIYQEKGINLYAIYTKTISVENDGYHALWDLRTGVNTNSFWTQDVFWYVATITTCKGGQERITGSMTLRNCLKSMSSDSESFDVDEPIIQDDILSTDYWLVFPNPNTGSFTIQTSNFDNIEQIQIINPLGQIIYTEQNPKDNTITLPSGAKGTFFVRITTEAESVTKKILVE